MRDKKEMKTAAKIVLPFVSIFLFCLLAEGTLRFIDNEYELPELRRKPDKAGRYIEIPLNKKDPYLFWRPPKSFEFRGLKHNIIKADDTVRIICLGDSCTQGFAIPGAKYIEAKETYPFRLQEMLNKYDKKAGRRFEVINAGVGGYSSLQGLRYFERELIEYKPDIVTFYFGVNDCSMRYIYTDSEQRILPQYLVEMHNALLNSRLYRFMAYLHHRSILWQWNKKKKRFGGRRLARVPLEEYKENIEKLHKILKKKGIRLVLINCPTNPAFLLAENNRALREMSIRHDIPLADIVKAAERYTAEDYEVFFDFCHTVPWFYKIIAKEIYKTLALNHYI